METFDMLWDRQGGKRLWWVFRSESHWFNPCFCLHIYEHLLREKVRPQECFLAVKHHQTSAVGFTSSILMDGGPLCNTVQKVLALMTFPMEMTVVRRSYGQLDSYSAIPFERKYHCCSRNLTKVIHFINLRTVVRISSACILAFLGEFITTWKSAWLLSVISCLAL